MGQTCYDGRCYLTTGKCNGYYECSEFEDELNCRKLVTIYIIVKVNSFLDKFLTAPSKVSYVTTRIKRYYDKKTKAIAVKKS